MNPPPQDWDRDEARATRTLLATRPELPRPTDAGSAETVIFCTLALAATLGIGNLVAVVGCFLAARPSTMEHARPLRSHGEGGHTPPPAPSTGSWVGIEDAHRPTSTGPSLPGATNPPGAAISRPATDSEAGRPPRTG